MVIREGGGLWPTLSSLPEPCVMALVVSEQVEGFLTVVKGNVAVQKG